MEMYGWVGTILRVDLTSQKVWKEPTAKYVKEFLGGRGINAKILYDEVTPRVGPYDPGNKLIFGTGPLAGTTAPSSGRVHVTSKSPMTGLYGDSSIGGLWGPELKYAGYDHIVISGKSKRPVYLWINNESVELRHAVGMWGKDTSETQRILEEEVGDADIRTICIGPAGENIVRFASIQTLYNHAAGRLGLGAVMGSKLLKAIAVRGTNDVNVARPDDFLKLSLEAHQMIDDNAESGGWVGHHPIALGYGSAGVGMEVAFRTEENLAGVLRSIHEFYDPSNYKEGLLLDFIDEYGVKYVGCRGCSLSCFTLVDLPGVGTFPFGCADTINFTAKIMNPDPKVMFEATVLCNKYGLDVISMASTVAFVMDLYERGVLTKLDIDGMTPEWGSKDATITLIHKVANREGFGDILAEGTLRAAKKIGKSAVSSSMTTKGLEVYGHDHRVYKGMALGAAVSSRPDLNRSFPNMERTDLFASVPMFQRFPCSVEEMEKEKQKLALQCKKLFGTDKMLYHQEYEGKAIATKWTEEKLASLDCIGICKNLGWGIDLFGGVYELEIIDLLSAATGMNFDLARVSERVINLERAFCVRQGITRKDDTIWKGFFENPIPDGIHKGEVVDREKFEIMKNQYYELRGWDVSTGIPTRKKLEELNLKYVADELEELEKTTGGKNE